MDERQKRRKTMLLSIRDGSTWTVMEKFATEYLEAFIIALGFAGQQLSFLITLPQAITAIVQMMSQKLIARYGRLSVVANAVLAQTIILALIISAGVATATGVVGLFWALPIFVVLFSAFHSAAAIAGNAWVSLMGDVIPDKSRSKFFGMRTRVNSITAIAALLGAGAIIQYSTLGIFSFFVLFGVGVIARLYSYSLMRQSHDPGGEILSREESFTLISFLARFRKSNFVRYALFLGTFWLAIFISAPFVTYYLLEVLAFTYVQYTILKIAFIIGSIASLHFIPSICDEYGNRKVFFLAAFGIGLYIAAYGVFSTFWAFLILDAIGGTLWAAFNLATANYLFDAVTSKKRALVNGYVTALRGAGILVGGTLSAAVFTWAAYIAPNLSVNTYQIIFWISGALRILLVIGFFFAVKEVRQVRSALLRDLVFVQAGTGLKNAAHLAFSTATKPIVIARKRLEKFEENELDRALLGWDDEPDKP